MKKNSSKYLRNFLIFFKFLFLFIKFCSVREEDLNFLYSQQIFLARKKWFMIANICRKRSFISFIRFGRFVPLPFASRIPRRTVRFDIARARVTSRSEWDYFSPESNCDDASRTRKKKETIDRRCEAQRCVAFAYFLRQRESVEKRHLLFWHLSLSLRRYDAARFLDKFDRRGNHAERI